MEDAAGLGAEQAIIDGMYVRLDDLRAEATDRLAAIRKEGPSGSPQNRSERDAFASLYEDRIASLDAVEDRLCFGRIDGVSERHYIGRIGISDPDYVPLLTDWRAKAAAPFYSATARDPQGIISRRHITTVGRRVAALEDDVFDVEALRSAGRNAELTGEGALLSALSARRTGRMTDIVATIQAEQDSVIRAPLAGALVVQGGPGTGKTAVALHRAAFLLYHHRERLVASGVLVIGPSILFLKYIDHVLPSLGETGAVSTTLAGLVPGVDASIRESDEVAAVKGRPSMARVIAAAVRERQRLPLDDQEVSIDGRRIVIRRQDIADAQARARKDGSPYNTARTTFVREMIRRLTTQLVEQLGGGLDEADRRELEGEIRDNRDVRIALNLAWLPLTPEQLLQDLFSRPHLLDHAAPRLSRADRALLRRSADAPFTDADLPLIDEAFDLLGDLPGGEARPGGPSREEVEYARGVLDIFGGGMVSADLLAQRMAGTRARLTIAEHAARDRRWTFGHVIVDEAQDLSPMAWRMLLRRCPSRSFTIVGDLAQASSGGVRGWTETLGSLFGNALSERTLTVGYRIPASVTDAAQAYASAAGLPVSPLSAVREVEDAVRLTRADDPIAEAARIARAHADRLASSGGGTSAVIAPESRLTDALRAVADAPEVSVLSPRDAKGLEFDVVVIADPVSIAFRPGDLYVALTRPTGILEIVHDGALPPGLG
ncbi:MAG: AAA family ATPase [Demequinaceae bacterium]|nr:AAA family ATPase [Demequinaceae bacterium]